MLLKRLNLRIPAVGTSFGKTAVYTIYLVIFKSIVNFEIEHLIREHMKNYSLFKHTFPKHVFSRNIGTSFHFLVNHAILFQNLRSSLHITLSKSHHNRQTNRIIRTTQHFIEHTKTSRDHFCEEFSRAFFHVGAIIRDKSRVWRGNSTAVSIKKLRPTANVDKYSSPD